MPSLEPRDMGIGGSVIASHHVRNLAGFAPIEARSVLVSRDLTTGGIIGVSLGCFFGASILLCILFPLCLGFRRRLKASQAASSPADDLETSMVDDSTISPLAMRKDSERRLPSREFTRDSLPGILSMSSYRRQSTKEFGSSIDSYGGNPVSSATTDSVPQPHAFGGPAPPPQVEATARPPQPSLITPGSHLVMSPSDLTSPISPATALRPQIPAGGQQLAGFVEEPDAIGGPLSTQETGEAYSAAMDTGTDGVQDAANGMLDAPLNASYYYGRLSADDASIERALREAHANDRLPEPDAITRITRIFSKSSKTSRQDSMDSFRSDDERKRRFSWRKKVPSPSPWSPPVVSQAAAPFIKREPSDLAESQREEEGPAETSQPLSPPLSVDDNFKPQDFKPAGQQSVPAAPLAEGSEPAAITRPTPSVAPAQQMVAEEGMSPWYRHPFKIKFKRIDSSGLEPGGIMPPQQAMMSPPLQPHDEIPTINPMQIMKPSTEYEEKFRLRHDLEAITRVAVLTARTPELATSPTPPSPPPPPPPPPVVAAPVTPEPSGSADGTSHMLSPPVPTPGTSNTTPAPTDSPTPNSEGDTEMAEESSPSEPRERETKTPSVGTQTPGTPSSPEYTCDECGRTFNQIHKLNHHKRYHDRPHACTHPGCDKSFGTKTHLGRHINDKHNKTRKYYCTEPTCAYSRQGGKSFPRKDNWRRHMINKHAQSPGTEPGPELIDEEMENT